MDVRSLQRPLKDRYRQDPASSRITLTARGSQTDAPVSCSIDLGRAIYDAQAHQGVGGAGTGACSGDLLLGALAACAQITCQMVAAAMGDPDREHRGYRRGRSRPARHPWNFQGGARRFSEYPGDLRCPRTAGNEGATERAASQDRAVLRGNANLAASTGD